MVSNFGARPTGLLDVADGDRLLLTFLSILYSMLVDFLAMRGFRAPGLDKFGRMRAGKSRRAGLADGSLFTV
jgi:hypothetical protein